MNKKIVFPIMLLLFSIMLMACASTDAPETSVTEQVPDDEALTLTLEELKAYNGQEDMPAYIAIDGVIYEVTDHPKWAGGNHNGYSAGQDLSEELNTLSPHGSRVLKDLPVVGTLASE